MNEITISAECLFRPYEKVCSTLIHEMVHLYCNIKGIKDTSRNGRYHNKRFKEQAEQRGLIIGYNKSIGHSPTTLQKSTKEYIEKIRNTDVFSLTRLKKIIKMKIQTMNLKRKKVTVLSISANNAI